MVLIDFSIYPIGKGESLSRYVSRAVDIIARSKLSYKVGPMGTTIEGAWDDLFGVVKKCFNEMKKDCHRIDFHIKGDYRKGRRGAIQTKVQSVEKRLRQPIKK
ncbi:MAG: MTH1187 family thiamine-binding protein [Acidobacteriota bacterium]